MQCTGTPMPSCSSRTTTSWPRWPACRAAIRPAGPAADDDDIDSRTTSPRPSILCDPRASHVPCTLIQNDSRINRTSSQPRPPSHVEAVVAELLPPRDVARRVDLRDAGQPGPAPTMRSANPGTSSSRTSAPSPSGLDFARPQRARTDEAHVAAQDVPELRQLVHRGRAHEPADARDARIARGRLHRAGTPRRRDASTGT